MTTGIGIEPLVQAFERDHDDYSAIMTKALADRLAEALAEWLHQQARMDWGYGAGEKLSPDELIRERYRGIRPAPGYPACPDHTEKRAALRSARRRRRTRASGSPRPSRCCPPASVSGFYFAHPEARYFAVGKIERDQVLDYQRRKGMDLRTVERWLGPHLNYEPDAQGPPSAGEGATAIAEPRGALA